MAPQYTPSQLRDFIDDIDAVLRAAAKAGTLKTVFDAERSRIVIFFFFFHFFFLTF